MPVRAHSPIPTTQMEVTSIRLEREVNYPTPTAKRYGAGFQ
jgi:hypothetical protein